MKKLTTTAAKLAVWLPVAMVVIGVAIILYKQSEKSESAVADAAPQNDKA